MSRNEDFRRAFSARCSAGGRWLVAYVAENGLDRCRLGLSVGRRIGGAVTRVRVKRRLREAFRLSRDRFPSGLDVVLVPKTHRLGSHEQLVEELVHTISRAAERLRVARKPQEQKPDG